MYIQESVHCTTRNLDSNHIFVKYRLILSQLTMLYWSLSFLTFSEEILNLNILYYHKYFCEIILLGIWCINSSLSFFSKQLLTVCYYNRPVILDCAMDAGNGALCIFPQKLPVKICGPIVESILCQIVGKTVSSALVQNIKVSI